MSVCVGFIELILPSGMDYSSVPSNGSIVCKPCVWNGVEESDSGLIAELPRLEYKKD